MLNQQSQSREVERAVGCVAVLRLCPGRALGVVDLIRACLGWVGTLAGKGQQVWRWSEVCLNFLMPEKVEKGKEVVRGNRVKTGRHVRVQVGEAALPAGTARALVNGEFEASLSANAVGRGV